MIDRELLQRYVDDGYKAVLTVGYSNGNKDYKIAKIPSVKGWTKSDYIPPSIDECIGHLGKGGWIGYRPPDGTVILDVADDVENHSENKHVLSAYLAYAEKEHVKPGKHKSRYGHHLSFKGNGVTTDSKTYCKLGLPVTYRTSGGSQVILEPSPDRKWIEYVPTDNLPQIPNGLREYNRNNKDDVFNCLVYVVGKAYRSGLLRGWEDIDAAFVGFSIQQGFAKDSALHALQSVFGGTFDEDRSEHLYERALEKHQHGDPLIGAGTFVENITKLDDDGKECIRFIKELSRLTKKSAKGKQEPTPTQAELLIAIGSKQLLFHDDMWDAYVEQTGSAVKVRSSSFKQYLAREMWLQHGKAPNTDSLNQALNVLEAKANYEGELHILHNRIAEHDNAFWYDLGNGKAVCITHGQWQIVDNPPLIFRRYPHQQTNDLPVSGGSLDSLFRFINIPDYDHRLLLKVWIVSFFVPGIGHPIIHPHGDQGSGKTTLCRYIKRIIDPSKIDVFFNVTDRNELVQTLEHHAFIAFDNVSDMQDWFSDQIAQAVTGAGFSKRKLFTDDEDVVYQIRRAIAINGISQVIHRPDAMDRSILFRLKEIDENQRIEERRLEAMFTEARPLILGAAFDALSKAIGIYPTLSLGKLPRMADFCLWGCAIAEGLGVDRMDFLNAYASNIKDQHKEIVGGNTLAQAIIEFMKDKTEWTGTMGKLYDALLEIANPNKKDRTFPKASNKLRQAIGRINLNLVKFGVRIDISDYDTKTGVPVTITYEPIQEDGKIKGTKWAPKKTNDINECAHSTHGAHKIDTLLEDTKNDGSYFIHEEDDGDDLPRLPVDDSIRKKIESDEKTSQSKFNITNDNIGWAKYSWNPVTGCLHGCEYCYARPMALRYYGDFKPTFHEERLQMPYNTKQGGDNDRVFLCSMADLFGEWVPNEWIEKVVGVCGDTPQWTYLCLTKNPKRYLEFDFPNNMWLGITCDTDRRYAKAYPIAKELKDRNTNIVFVSFEPLKEGMTLNNPMPFHWVIIGGQSKTIKVPASQPQLEWVEGIMARARKDGCRIYCKSNLTIEGIDKPTEIPSAIGENI